ncbi:Pectinesterase, catalytic [Gossypium australe]|uniref:pectinesterase n=1 Tax=Gossypium australe TaxID=47621 RepID=A0A5B6X2M8_9ROSI|nr:Pectinesterase, catalytic [Gossypium australe]
MQHKVPFLLMFLTLSLRISIANADECIGNGGSKFAYPIVVDKSGGGNFTSVQSAIDSIPQENHQWNSYNHPLLLKHALSERKVLGVLQAVAARILGDRSAFFECGFLGLQDTLWDASGRHYFAKSHIEGAADFIFDTQGRGSSDDPSGFVFKGGTLFGNVRPYLGRAYGPYSRVIFQETTINADVVPQGWDAWKFPGKEENFMYAEVNCKGPGSDTSNRVTWEKTLTPSQLQQFSLSYFIDQDGWISKLPME